MHIVIDLPDEVYELLKYFRPALDPDYKKEDDVRITLTKAVLRGTPFPKGHGRLIDADKCIKQAWNDFYKHEEEWEKKDPDYVGVKRFHDQNGFECCLKTIGESPTVIESEDNT